MTQPNGIRHPQKRAFIAGYRQSGNIRAACEAAGISRPSYYVWMENDLVFAAAARQAKEEFGDLLEAKLAQMAMRQDNVTALIVALKMAGRFRERVEVSIDIEQRVRTMARELGLDEEEVVTEAQRLLGSGSAFTR